MLSITFENHPLRIIHMQKVYFIVASYLSVYKTIIIPMYIFSICFHCFFFLVLIFTLQNFIKTLMIIIIIKFIGQVGDGDKLDYRVSLFISFEKIFSRNRSHWLSLTYWVIKPFVYITFLDDCEHLQRKHFALKFGIQIFFIAIFAAEVAPSVSLSLKS